MKLSTLDKSNYTNYYVVVNNYNGRIKRTVQNQIHIMKIVTNKSIIHIHLIFIHLNKI